jgi:hypothetical protein
MERYFPAYSDYGQDPATARQMCDYYAPELMFTGYVGSMEPTVFRDRASFLEFDVSHPASYERLTPEEMAVDERREQVFAIIRFEFIDRKTGAVLAEERGATLYQLMLDERGAIKIKHLVFFPQRLPPGVLSGAEIFRKDRQTT